MTGNESPLKVVAYFREKAKSQEPFKMADLATAGDYSIESVKAYISKLWLGYLEQKGTGAGKTYTVRRQFLRVAQDEFLAVFTQKRPAVPNYRRVKHEQVIQYEFLLPLSKRASTKGTR